MFTEFQAAAAGESHDQYRTLLTYVELRNKHSYHASLHIYWDDTFSGFRQCIWLGWRREATAFTSFRWLLNVDNLLIA